MKKTVILLVLLVGCATVKPDYNRKDWRHWSDEDGDCQNTRHEVLIAASVVQVTFKTGKQCLVDTGKWLDPFSGKTFTDAKKLDIDHFVPLSNVHHSGGWEWSPERKKLYANDMRSKDHLIAVEAKLNRQKGARGPEKWVPPNKRYVCEYVKRWVEIKMRWGLSMTEDEAFVISADLGACK